jgi:DNA (cytosine-5)-methyltransferase 1
MTNEVDEMSAASRGSLPLTFGSLFAGIGGFDLGLERAGMRCEWQVEIDPYARAVLAKHWPDVRRHEDVRTFPPPEGEWGVDVICGGFPCQDISVAGKGAGLAGARSGLWYEYARIIGELRPRYVIVENVAALLARGMGTVLGDLSTLGYDAEWHVIPASAVGAPHRRERVWIVAYARDQGLSRSRSDAQHEGEVLKPCHCDSEKGRCDVPDAIGIGDALRGDGSPCSQGVAGRRLHAGGSQRNRGARCAGQAWQGACDVADANQPGLEGRHKHRKCASELLVGASGGAVASWWSVEPDVGRVAHGVPARVDRLRCLGNAVVPQIVEVIGRQIVGAA